ncbi:MAG TPA: glycosyltransferase [Bryobacteraceae bacterium]|nr:glycosyltransferase [Bryobacteraceae bacterium]
MTIVQKLGEIKGVKKLDFIYFDAGGGHRSAAMALQQVIAQQGRPWEVRTVNLQEQLDNLDIFRRITGIRLQDYYNLLLKKGWTLGSSELLKGLHIVIRMFQPALVKLLSDFWRASRPDMVVSLIPNFNRALKLSLEAALPGTPLVTILTDIADYPPHFWIEQQMQYLICGSDRAVSQARELGHADDHVFRASGMILNPRFYEPIAAERAAERQRLGLDAQLPTGLVLFGGEGSAVMLEIARSLQAAAPPLQLILICGRNEKLAARLRGMQAAIPMFVEGFTREVPYYMHLSDFFIGKPGPGSISEAIAMQLPVIVERNAWNLPQERYNCEWVKEQDVGMVLHNFRGIRRAVAELLEPAAYARMRGNAAALRNRAVFEIPDMLERILAQ